MAVVRAAHDAALAGLTVAGHALRVRDLAAEGFEPAMSLTEREAYHGDQPVISDLIGAHAADLEWAEALLFIYASGPLGLPAVSKGWLERVLVPGVAFRFDERTGKVKPTLGHVRLVMGVAVYDATRAQVRRFGDPGRRVILRALRLVTGPRTRARWFGLYDTNRATSAQRAEFLDRVRLDMARL